MTFAVPRLYVESVKHLLQLAADETAEKLHYGLMIHTRFHVKAGNVSGYLVIILGSTSLDRLLRELENRENRQVK